MTAQIAVMNKLGIALAADSAASIGADAEKIYTADKLHPLSARAPVGVMVYGNAEFLGLPWETVVGAYRKQLGDKTFAALSGYAGDFFGFIEGNEAMFPKEVREGYVGNSEHKSGVVFAGFGEDEYAPACLQYEVAGMADGKPRHRIVARAAAQQVGSAILPFAQTETVRLFIGGIHPDYEEHLAKTVVDLLADSMGQVFAHPQLNVDAALINEIVRSNDQRLINMVRDWRNESRQRYWGPVVQMVQFLPKDELASTAENLVNLTKFRQRIAAERETVGGPIDVALITKGGGFVWVKNKRYYPAELNPRGPIT